MFSFLRQDSCSGQVPLEHIVLHAGGNPPDEGRPQWLRDMPSEGDLTLIDLKKKIPSRNQMYIYEKLFPVLEMIREQSEFLSTDMEPSSCHIVPILYHIKEKITEVKPYLTVRNC